MDRLSQFTEKIKKLVPFMVIVLLLPTAVLANEQQSGPHVAGGVSFDVPGGWVQAKPHTSMRLFQFEASSPQADVPAVMAVFYFGPGQGGAIDANIARWKGQFTPGKESAAPQIVKSKVNDLDVTTLYLEGTYNGGMGFAETKPDYAMLGAIAEGNKGPVFFKMTGPKAVIAEVRTDFEAFTGTFRQK